MSESTGFTPKKSKEDLENRTCIASKRTFPPARMLRFVLEPTSQAVLLDFSQKLPGRGCYVYPLRKNIEEAIAKNLFSKAFKTKVEVSLENIMEQYTKSFEKFLFFQMILFRRANVLDWGHSKVEDGLRKGEGRILFFSQDVSEGVLKKFTQWGKRMRMASYRVPFSKYQLGECLGSGSCSLFMLKANTGFEKKVFQELKKAQELCFIEEL